MSLKEKKLPVVEVDEQTAEMKTLILYNDDVNSFDFVIKCLMEVCEHDHLQAENCAWVAHYRGKCAVKKGPWEDIKPRYEELTNRKLTCEIK